jgi:hypothetical protein
LTLKSIDVGASDRERSPPNAGRGQATLGNEDPDPSSADADGEGRRLNRQELRLDGQNYTVIGIVEQDAFARMIKSRLPRRDASDQRLEWPPTLRAVGIRRSRRHDRLIIGHGALLTTVSTVGPSRVRSRRSAHEDQTMPAKRQPANAAEFIIATIDVIEDWPMSSATEGLLADARAGLTGEQLSTRHPVAIREVIRLGRHFWPIDTTGWRGPIEAELLFLAR